MELSRPEYWSGYPFPPPGDLPNPGIEPRAPTLQVDSLPAEPQGKPNNSRVGSLFLLLDLLHPGIEPGSPSLQANSLPTELFFPYRLLKSILWDCYFYLLYKTVEWSHNFRGLLENQSPVVRSVA